MGRSASLNASRTLSDSMIAKSLPKYSAEAFFQEVEQAKAAVECLQTERLNVRTFRLELNNARFHLRQALQELEDGVKSLRVERDPSDSKIGTRAE